MRIASLSPAATEILFALGLEKDIVCRDQFSNFPDAAKDIPALRGHQKVDTDALKTFSPEIILTGTVIQEKLAAELRGRGLGVIHQDPRTINDIYESIRQLGTIFERTGEGEAVILKMQQGFNAVKSRLVSRNVGAVREPPLRVYVEEWHHPPMVGGNWVPEIIRIAGGESFPIGGAVEAPHGSASLTTNGAPLSRAVTLEEVLAFDPDLIVISWCGAGVLADKKLLMERSGWSELRAVREGHVRVIDDSLLNRPGPRLVEGAQRLYGWLFEQLSS